MDRRALILGVPLLVATRIRTQPTHLENQAASITRSDIDKLLNTTRPELHCMMNHDHTDASFNDWERSLTWSAGDCGHNEGAGPVIKLAVKNGLSYPELMYGCPDSEKFIPLAEEAMKDPDTLDRYGRFVPPAQLAALKKMLKDGRSFTEVLAEAPEESVGEVWRRKAMMRFASVLAKKESLRAAIAIATASQWHNCQEFKCLLRHPNEIAQWLKGQSMKT